MSLQELVDKYGSKAKAAAALNMPVSTFKDRLARENRKPVKHETLVPDLGTFTKVVYFTDAHNQPGMSQERFKWLAGLVNDQKPDVLVDGGDFDDFNSLCSHERNETYKGRLKPLLAADLECAARAKAELKRLIKHPCRKIVTLGNHEHRIWKYEDENPAMYGIVSSIFTDILKSTGWEHYEYGAYVDIAGVSFTHVPFNGMAPVGGADSTKTVATNSTCDVVFGHTHEWRQVHAPKFGSNKGILVLNGGCFMPENYLPNYVKNKQKEFWYGAHVLMIKDGRIKSIHSKHISELQLLYGGDS